MLDEENLPEIEDMVSVCAGLVIIDEESEIIRLVHYITQEYFERTQSQWFPNTQSSITTICVTYLSFDAFEHGLEQLQSNQFFQYTTQNWGHHARKVPNLSRALSHIVKDFLQSEAKVNASSQGLFAFKFSSNLSYSQGIQRSVTGLHLVAHFGLEAILKQLLDISKVELDGKDSNNRTPLSWAAENGHEAVVELLLKTSKVNINMKDTIYKRTPLSWAAEEGHEGIVKLLLNTSKVKGDLKDDFGRTPLSRAAEKGHIDII